MKASQVAFGVFVAAAGAAHFVVYDRKLRSFPARPPRVSPAEARALADRGGAPWIVLAGVHVKCAGRFSKGNTMTAPIAEDPSVAILYRREKIPCDAAAGDFAGTITRGATRYELATWDGPGNARLGRILGVVIFLIGVSYLPLRRLRRAFRISRGRI